MNPRDFCPHHSAPHLCAPCQEMRAEKAEAALATAEHCGKDYATERACGECLRCLRAMCEIEAEGNCNRTMEICALQAALATAQGCVSGLKGTIHEQVDHIHSLQAALATARALAFKEAARWHDAAAAESERAAEMYEKRGLWVDEQAWIDRATYHFEDAKTLRRMAPFPPSLMAIPREVVEEIKQAGRMMLAVSACQNGCDPSDMTCATNRQRAALSALEGAME